MAYSGASVARQARETLGKALAALQEDPNIPPDVLQVAQNLAQAVGALFEAERASSEPDGKASVKSAVGFVSQTLALLQEVRGQHQGVQLATELIAQTLSMLFPLRNQPSRLPPPGTEVPTPAVPPAAPVPSVDTALEPVTLRDQTGPLLDAPIPLVQSMATHPEPAQHGAPQAGLSGQAAFVQPGPAQPAPFSAAPASAAPAPSEPAPSKPAQAAFSAPAHVPVGAPFRDGVKREKIEVNIGATTESNFYVGFSGDVSEGGVFASTYNILPRGTPVQVLITLPGGFEKEVNGFVRFVRDPMDMNSESEPGMGIQFEALDQEARELILRFIRKRPPMFYDE
jgi:uncharacterized protein (TIGR02266 family)